MSREVKVFPYWFMYVTIYPLVQRLSGLASIYSRVALWHLMAYFTLVDVQVNEPLIVWLMWLGSLMVSFV